jgi:hypothetical protein
MGEVDKNIVPATRKVSICWETHFSYENTY